MARCLKMVFNKVLNSCVYLPFCFRYILIFFSFLFKLTNMIILIYNVLINVTMKLTSTLLLSVLFSALSYMS